MNIVSIIEKKKDKKPLTCDEINYAVNGYVMGIISDAQMSSLLMAICINGMNMDETYFLTKAMIESGDQIDLSKIPGIKVDKHSTGGVGDKTTLVVAPIVSACGVPVAKLSGRGLGHTGGTIDKLESIKGFRSDLSEEEFIKQVREIGIVDAEQTKEIVPADKKIYALRDVTGTTRSIPLIASSIMSKKIAAGADKIVLDVKTGSGALITDFEESVELAKTMVMLGKKFNKETIALITDMNEPLGSAIGNGLEVEEAIKTLEGNGEKSLVTLSITLAAYMISLGKEIPFEEAKEEAIDALTSKKALNKFKEFVKYQGGDIKSVNVSKKTYDIYANGSGYVKDIDETLLALECLNMGSGRKNKDDVINPGVGMVVKKHIGDYVKKGDALVTVYYDNVKVNDVNVIKSFILSEKKEEGFPLIYTVIK